jgi:hypothetical protein
MQRKSSLLSFLTISGSIETVVFAYCKELEDVGPADIYWYEKKGQNGVANYLWQEKQLKQWLLVGSDDDVSVIWQRLLGEKHFSFSWGDVVVQFDMPEIKAKERDEEDFVKIKTIPICGRHNRTEEYIASGFSHDISFLINEKSNCTFLEGYKTNATIKSLIPFGLLAENTLAKCLEAKVHAVLEKRGIFWQLQGNKKTEKGERSSRQLSGFIQATKDYKAANRISIRNLAGDKVLGTADIDIISGKWETAINDDADQGQFLIQEKNSGAFVCGEKFYLLKEIKINTNIVHTVLTDFFGRTVTIAEKMDVIQLPESTIWDARSAPDDRQSQIELSDRLARVFAAL